MSTAVTCVYALNPTGVMTAAQLAAAITNAKVPTPTWLGALGVTKTSDTTAVVAGQAVRTIVFNITSPMAQQSFIGSFTSIFWGLMNLAIRAAVNQPVVESAPAVSGP